MSPTATPESGEPSVDAPARDDQPSRDDLHLKREVLLARLFPTEVTRPKLGRYDVLEFVGEGGMGTVFAAYDPKLDRRVAVKLLRQSGDGGQRRARLLREAKALARLSHLNIVTIHEVWEEQGEVYIAMEFVEGETLFEWQATARPWKGLLEVYRQAGQGLMAVHEAGLVYRDFKPHNVIRRNDGVVKLLDFGLARQDEGAPEPPATPRIDDRGRARARRSPHATRGGDGYSRVHGSGAARGPRGRCRERSVQLLRLAVGGAAGRAAPSGGPQRACDRTGAIGARVGTARIGAWPGPGARRALPIDGGAASRSGP
ncbi:MAG: serine/threonine protein kinase [Deltaproteobacteria bacterium]|nr:serine/threonine protein kinase [Deltaproteobacteria bacterium]